MMGRRRKHRVPPRQGVAHNASRTLSGISHLTGEGSPKMTKRIIVYRRSVMPTFWRMNRLA